MAKMGRRKRSRLITQGLMAPDGGRRAGAVVRAEVVSPMPEVEAALPVAVVAEPEQVGDGHPAGEQPRVEERLDIEALARRVKERRREKGWTQADVARNGGPSAGTISQIERCLSELPAAETLAKLDAGLEWEPNTCDMILRGGAAEVRELVAS